jgi:hypothetical protein
LGEPVKKHILYGGQFAGLNREYSVEYSIGSARLGCGAAYGSAWKGNILGNILRRGLWLGLNGSNMARVDGTRLQPLARVGCAWANSSESSGGACGLPRALIKLIFAPVSSYG